MRYGTNVLFRGLSFQLDSGRALAITGPNGSGKSTLLRILAGLLRPVTGEVHLRVEGRDMPRETRLLHAGVAAPYVSVYDGFSAWENLAFLARVRGMPEAEARIRSVLETVQLYGRHDELVRTYSSGMRQRMKLATALLADPPLLLLDEAGARLDDEGRAMVARVVDEQLDSGGLVVVATNDSREAQRCDTTISVTDFT